LREKLSNWALSDVPHSLDQTAGVLDL
jgi:hypothetical protein